MAKLIVQLDPPLDQALLERCLEVVDAQGGPVPGLGATGPGERSWRFEPSREI